MRIITITTHSFFKYFLHEFTRCIIRNFLFHHRYVDFQLSKIDFEAYAYKLFNFIQQLLLLISVFKAFSILSMQRFNSKLLQ